MTMEENDGLKDEDENEQEPVPEGQRLGLIYVEVPALLRILTGQATVNIEGLPEDAVLHNAVWDFSRNSVVLVVEHPDFDTVPPGGMIPLLGNVHVQLKKK